MADESPKPIETVKVGEEVLCKSDGDPTGPLHKRVVDKVYKHSPTALVNVHIEELLVRSTPNHPFFSKDDGWLAAIKLRPGHQVLSHDGRWRQGYCTVTFDPKRTCCR
jgi:hypothetical protein